MFPHDAPDPTVIHDGGAFFVYTTESSYRGRHVHVPILRSRDLVHWQFVGDALPTLPAWGSGDTWAPHVSRVDDRFVLYVSVRDDLTGLMQVATAVSPRAQGPFVPTERPLLGRWNETIDPMVIMIHHDRFLYWSQENTIRVARLSADGLAVERPRTIVLLPIGVEGSGYESVVEGPWALRHGGWTYLFVSGDVCCGPNAHYALLVARSRSPTGPFRRASEPVVEKNASFLAPGHGSTIRVGSATWLVYHATSGAQAENRLLMIDRIDWANGWPVVNRGRGPSSTPEARPAGQ